MKLQSFIGFRLNENFLNPTKRINEIFVVSSGGRYR